MRFAATPILMVIVLAGLVAAPVVLAGPGADGQVAAPPSGTLLLPQVQPPPPARRPVSAPQVVVAAADEEAPGPLSAPDVARLRLKQFVTDSYARTPQGAAGTAGRPALEVVLGQIESLPPDQVQALDARLGPVIWATRSLAMRDTPRAEDATAPAQDTDPEALRRQLDAYFARLEPYGPRIQGSYPAYPRLISHMRAAVQGMTPDELNRLQDMFNVLPSARQVLDIDPADIVGVTPTGAPAPGLTSALDGTGPARLQAGSIHTLSNCNDMAFGPVVTAVLVSIANTASDIASLLSDDYMVTTFNIKDIVQLIAKGIALPLQLLAVSATADLNYFVNCNEGAHQALMAAAKAEMEERTGAIQSMLDDSAQVTDLKRILANRMDRIDTFNAEYRRLTLRLAIEKDLLRQGDPRISMFQVPNDMCVTVGEHQQCGQLTTVHDIVADTIFQNRSAGFDTSLASVALQDGEGQEALGRYKAAYTRYRYAYQLAVRSNK
jgi:hypothetical protein